MGVAVNRLTLKVLIAVLTCAFLSGAAPATKPASRPSSQPADPAMVTSQQLLDLLKDGNVDKARLLVIPITRSVGPDDTTENLQQLASAFRKGTRAQLLESKSTEVAAAVIVLFSKPGRPQEPDPDPLLLVKRDGVWKALADDPGQYELSERERADVAELQAWFKARKKELRGPSAP